MTSTFLLITASIILGFIIVLFGIIISQKKNALLDISDIKRDVARLFEPKPNGPVHVLFCVADHFEPGNGNAGPNEQKIRVDEWLHSYPKLASKHQDSDGVYPQHTFFFPPPLRHPGPS